MTSYLHVAVGLAVGLAVALPLLLCVLVLLLLLLRLRRSRARDRVALDTLGDERTELEKQLASIKQQSSQKDECGVSSSEVLSSFYHFLWGLERYVTKWIDENDDPSSPPRNESAARIELLLFPELPPEHDHFLAVGRDIRWFPNPHQYTPAEICTFLQQPETRQKISHHLITSILLNGISLDGNPFQNLLPFAPADVYALDKLRTLIRGMELFLTVPAHISRFADYCAIQPKADDFLKDAPRKKYVERLGSLFEPYFTSKSPAEVTQRQQQFDVVLDAALKLGLNVIGTAHERIEYRWESRVDIAIMEHPALYALQYKEEELVNASQLSASTSARWAW